MGDVLDASNAMSISMTSRLNVLWLATSQVAMLMRAVAHVSMMA